MLRADNLIPKQFGKITNANHMLFWSPIKSHHIPIIMTMQLQINKYRHLVAYHIERHKPNSKYIKVNTLIKRYIIFRTTNIALLSVIMMMYSHVINHTRGNGWRSKVSCFGRSRRPNLMVSDPDRVTSMI